MVLSLQYHSFPSSIRPFPTVEERSISILLLRSSKRVPNALNCPNSLHATAVALRTLASTEGWPNTSNKDKSPDRNL